jgi:hypothetical protein
VREASLNGKKNGPFASNQNDEVDKLFLHGNNALLFDSANCFWANLSLMIIVKCQNALSFLIYSYDISEFSSAYFGPLGAKSSEL